MEVTYFLKKKKKCKRTPKKESGCFCFYKSFQKGQASIFVGHVSFHAPSWSDVHMAQENIKNAIKGLFRYDLFIENYKLVSEYIIVK